MNIQIIGPISGVADYLERFAEADRQLRLAGHDVWNPAAESAKEPGMPYEYYMQRRIEHLQEADAIYCLSDFEKSPGARREYCLARYIYNLSCEYEGPAPTFYLCDPTKCAGCDRRGCFFPVYNDRRECAITADPEAAELGTLTGEPVIATAEAVFNRLFRFGS